MPLYRWKDKKTKKEVEVIRTFSEYENPPTLEEKEDMSAEEFLDAEWERIVGTGIHVTKGNSWGPGKGNW